MENNKHEPSKEAADKEAKRKELIAKCDELLEYCDKIIADGYETLSAVEKKISELKEEKANLLKKREQLQSIISKDDEPKDADTYIVIRHFIDCEKRQHISDMFWRLFGHTF